MAKGQYLSGYQKGIVKRYYAHADARVSQKLAEIVSDLYVTTDAKKAAKLWESARAALEKTDAKPASVDRVIQAKDLPGLAKLAGEVKVVDRPPPPKGG